jgi:hypothetical protein
MEGERAAQRRRGPLELAALDQHQRRTLQRERLAAG